MKNNKRRKGNPHHKEYPHYRGPYQQAKSTANHIDQTHKKTRDPTLPVSLPKHRDKNIFQPQSGCEVAVGVSNEASARQKRPFGTQRIPPNRKVHEINKKLCYEFGKNGHKTLLLFYHKIKKTHITQDLRI